MSAHIALPRIETENLPATLSPKMVTGLLRGELDFRGVVFTDALDMRGIAAHYPNGEAAVRAVKAGVDVLLYPPSVEQAFQAVKRAVQSGEIKESRVEESSPLLLARQSRLARSLSDLNNSQCCTTSTSASLEDHRNGVTLFATRTLCRQAHATERCLYSLSTRRLARRRSGRAFLAGLVSRHAEHRCHHRHDAPPSSRCQKLAVPPTL